MNDRVMQFRVGVVVLATSIISAILVTLNSPASKEWVPGLKHKYQVTIELERAPGIGPNTPVRKNGLLIGRVASVDDLDDHVAVHVDVDADRRLYAREPYTCQVRTSVLGDATIEFLTGPVPPGTPPLADGAVVKGEVLGNPLEAITDLQGDLKRMINSLSQAGDEISRLADRVNQAIGDETEPGRVSRLLDKLEIAMDKFSTAATTLEQFFGDPEMKSAVREARMTMGDIRDVAKGVQEPIESISRNLKNLEGFTEPLGRNGEQVAGSVIDALDGLGRVVEELTVLTEALNSREGTLGQLIHNPQVYDNLNRLLANSNHLVLRINDLSMRLRPVVEDARVFMDKVAREPGRIVGGAVNPSIIK